MAYISTDDVKKIRVALKNEMPQYKFSVVRDWHGSVTISMMKGPAFAEFEYFDRYAGEYKKGTLGQNDGYDQINTYHTGDFYGKENAKIFDKIVQIAKTAPTKKWYDDSDAMTDYFDTAFYIHLNVGKFGKDYEVVKEAA